MSQKCCPIMSSRRQGWGMITCPKEECAFWDEYKQQCCIKTNMTKNQLDTQQTEKLKNLQEQIDAVSIGFPSFSFFKSKGEIND